MKGKELVTDHPYYCSTSNYYSNDGGLSYDTWQDFKNDWAEFIDLDYNHVFRFDIKEAEGSDIEERKDEGNTSKYYGEIFFMLQRKGIFRPCVINNINEEDLEEIKDFLEPHWEYTKRMWEPFN